MWGGGVGAGAVSGETVVETVAETDAGDQVRGVYNYRGGAGGEDGLGEKLRGEGGGVGKGCVCLPSSFVDRSRSPSSAPSQDRPPG